MAEIIFVCNGNMCRSPMAEGIMKRALTENGLEASLCVSSMGIHAHEGNSATDHAVEICRENGIDISNHRSRPLIPDELKLSTFIFVMETVQIDFIDIFFPQVSDRLYMLAAWPVRKIKKATIQDPVGRSLATYRKTFTILQQQIDRILPEMVIRYKGIQTL